MKRHLGRLLIFLGVGIWLIADVRSVVTKYGFTFPVLRDPDSNVFQQYRLDSFPITFVLDTEGIVLVKHQGYK